MSPECYIILRPRKKLFVSYNSPEKIGRKVVKFLKKIFLSILKLFDVHLFLQGQHDLQVGI